MRAMVLESPGAGLVLKNVSIPIPDDEQLLIKVTYCGVCRTDLHIIDGELKEPKLPLIPGHQIVGIVTETGKNVNGFSLGDKVGVPWLGYTCGECKFCISDRENLCDNAKFTGYNIDGGFAEYAAANQKYCFKLPSGFSDLNAAPLLCGGLIGYRSYRMTGDNVRNLGIYGFGSAAHIITQAALWEGKKVFSFVKNGDVKAKEFAIQMGSHWSGYSDEAPPEKLDAAIIFAPVGSLIPNALRVLDKGGIIVCGGIHMSDIPSFEYKYLWEERKIVSVANLTRKDGEEFLKLASGIPIKTKVKVYSLENTNTAIKDLRDGNMSGSAVIEVNN